MRIMYLVYTLEEELPIKLETKWEKIEIPPDYVTRLQYVNNPWPYYQGVMNDLNNRIKELTSLQTDNHMLLYELKNLPIALDNNLPKDELYIKLLMEYVTYVHYHDYKSFKKKANITPIKTEYIKKLWVTDNFDLAAESGNSKAGLIDALNDFNIRLRYAYDASHKDLLTIYRNITTFEQYTRSIMFRMIMSVLIGSITLYAFLTSSLEKPVKETTKNL
ncbi:hypothetical protein ACTFIR_002884 [Dictyostelium discoideum]